MTGAGGPLERGADELVELEPLGQQLQEPHLLDLHAQVGGGHL